MMRKIQMMVLACVALLVGASLAMAAVEMPAGFNGELVLPPNSELVNAMEEPPYAEVVSPDSMEAVYNFYKKDLVDKGWKIAGDYPNMGGTYQIQFKKDGKTLSVAIGKMNDGKAIARIMLS